jgi:hypothetical protein
MSVSSLAFPSEELAVQASALGECGLAFVTGYEQAGTGTDGGCDMQYVQRAGKGGGTELPGEAKGCLEDGGPIQFQALKPAAGDVAGQMMLGGGLLDHGNGSPTGQDLEGIGYFQLMEPVEGEAWILPDQVTGGS